MRGLIFYKHSLAYSNQIPFALRLFVWEILHSTIRKMNKHVLKIQKELEEAKGKLERQHKRVSLVSVHKRSRYTRNS